jgi:hypothetical protein
MPAMPEHDVTHRDLWVKLAALVPYLAWGLLLREN